MTRQTASGAPNLEDDKPYQATTLQPAEGWLQESDGQYGKRLQLVVEFKVDGQGGTLRDWFGLTLKPTTTGGKSKLHRLLNALAEKPADAECWWDAETLEWGYDMEEGSAPYGHIQAGLGVTIKGENVSNGKGPKRFKILSYKAAVSGA